MALPGHTPADAGDARTLEPRPASERALRGLDVWLAGPLDTAVVAGAAGAGTTFVLRQLEAQERERRGVVFSPFLHIGEQELEKWLDGLARASGLGSLEAWLEPAARPPLLLVDEAHAAAPAALEELARLRAARGPQLRVCLGGCAGPALERAGECIGGRTGPLLIELPPWSDDDLGALARTLCEVAPADPEALVAAADGSPGQLRLLWDELREPPAPAPAPERLPPHAPEPEPEPPVLAVEPEPAPAFEAPPSPALEPDPEPPPPLAAAPGSAFDGPGTPAPPAPPQRPRSRLARLPWFHAASLVVGFLLGIVGGWQGWSDGERVREAVVEAPVEPAGGAVSAAPPVVSAPAPTLHDVQVNALPWASIRIDGEVVGVTPLVQRGLAAGPHEFEATFPDGRQERRTVEIGPDTRFVSFAD
jgi:hypothetical protein